MSLRSQVLALNRSDAKLESNRAIPQLGEHLIMSTLRSEPLPSGTTQEYRPLYLGQRR